MAQFRAWIRGQRGEASRLGSQSSGITAEVNGWNSGVRVEAFYDHDKSGDAFQVFATYGSHARHAHLFLGTVTLEGERVVFNQLDTPTEILALYVTPDAIRSAYDGYDDDEEHWIEQATEEELRGVGFEVIDAIYDSYRRALSEAITTRISEKELS